MTGRYNDLFEWYLAFLRKNAQSKASAAHFTPLSLIEADKELLKSVIEKDSAARSSGTSAVSNESVKSSNGFFGVWAVIAICAAFVSLTVLGLYLSSSGAVPYVWISLLVLFGSFVVLWVSPRSNVQFDRERITGTLNKASTLLTVEASSAEDLGARIDFVVSDLCKQIELMRQKELLIFEYCPFLLCKLNHEGKLVELNEETQQMSGYSNSELIGVAVQDLLSAESKPVFLQSLARCLQSGLAEQIEIRMKCKNTEFRDLLWRIEWSVNGAAYFCMAEDISARKNNERLRSEISAMLNHDLRAPISALSFWVDNMLLGTYGEITEATGDTLKRTSRNVRTVLSLLDDLLDTEKLESGTMKAHRSMQKVQDCFEQVSQLFDDWFKEKHMQLNIESSDLEFYIDVDLSTRILSNYCSNALKWSANGSIVSMRAKLDGDYVILEVEDNGAGIPPAQQEILFQRWGTSSTKVPKKSASSGLGLYISKQFAELQGGAVGYRSPQNGVGSIFWVSLQHRK